MQRRLKERPRSRLGTRLSIVGLALAAFVFTSPTYALSGATGTPGDPGLTVDSSSTLSSSTTSQGTNGGDGGAASGEYEYGGGNGGAGGDGVDITGGSTVCVNSGTFIAGSGGTGGAGAFGGAGGDGGNGITVSGSNVLTNINGGSFTGGAGGTGSEAAFGGEGGNGGNALYDGSSNIVIRGGSFTTGQGGFGGVSTDGPSSLNGSNGYDFDLNGGILDILGNFASTSPITSGSGTFSGTLLNNNGAGGLENVTYSYLVNSGKIEFNQPTPVPEASTTVAFTVMFGMGLFMLARRRRTEELQPA